MVDIRYPAQSFTEARSHAEPRTHSSARISRLASVSPVLALQAALHADPASIWVLESGLQSSHLGGKGFYPIVRLFVFLVLFF